MLSTFSGVGDGSVSAWHDSYAAIASVASTSQELSASEVQHIGASGSRFHVVCDARLDNRAELIRKLSLDEISNPTDSFLLANAWDRWGEDCLAHLLGAFSFAVWDSARHELFAARDHVGEYPLFFHRYEGFVAIASTIKALLALPGLSQNLDEQRIADWLIYAAPNRNTTFFASIERLPAGHYLHMAQGRIRTREYWRPGDCETTLYSTDDEYAKALSNLLDKATEARLRTAGGVATQLSAGLDSGSVTASAASLLALGGNQLTSYTSIPRSGSTPRYTQSGLLLDEQEGAGEVAAWYPNIHHVMVTTESMNLVETIRLLQAELGEPVMNAANWLWYLKMLEHAREHQIGAILQGALGNYTISYQTMQPLADMFRRLRWRRLWRTILQLRTNGDTSFRKAGQFALAGFYPPILLSLRENIGSVCERLFINPEFAQRFKLEEAARKVNRASLYDTSEQRQSFEQFDFAPFAAAARSLTGVDLRDPTADRRIWEFCLSIPLEQYIVGGRSRSLIRRAMDGRLPASTLARNRRGLQGADWYLMMENAMPALRRELLAIAQSPIACGVLDIVRLEQAIDTFPVANFHDLATMEKWHVSLLRSLSLGMFLRSYDLSAPVA